MGDSWYCTHINKYSNKSFSSENNKNISLEYSRHFRIISYNNVIYWNYLLYRDVYNVIKWEFLINQSRQISSSLVSRPKQFYKLRYSSKMIFEEMKLTRVWTYAGHNLNWQGRKIMSMVIHIKSNLSVCLSGWLVACLMTPVH